MGCLLWILPNLRLLWKRRSVKQELKVAGGGGNSSGSMEIKKTKTRPTLAQLSKY